MSHRVSSDGDVQAGPQQGRHRRRSAARRPTRRRAGGPSSRCTLSGIADQRLGCGEVVLGEVGVDDDVVEAHGQQAVVVAVASIITQRRPGAAGAWRRNRRGHSRRGRRSSRRPRRRRRRAGCGPAGCSRRRRGHRRRSQRSRVIGWLDHAQHVVGAVTQGRSACRTGAAGQEPAGAVDRVDDPGELDLGPFGRATPRR